MDHTYTWCNLHTYFVYIILIFKKSAIRERLFQLLRCLVTKFKILFSNYFCFLIWFKELSRTTEASQTAAGSSTRIQNQWHQPQIMEPVTPCPRAGLPRMPSCRVPLALSPSRAETRTPNVETGGTRLSLSLHVLLCVTPTARFRYCPTWCMPTEGVIDFERSV